MIITRKSKKDKWPQVGTLVVVNRMPVIIMARYSKQIKETLWYYIAARPATRAEVQMNIDRYRTLKLCDGLVEFWEYMQTQTKVA